MTALRSLPRADGSLYFTPEEYAALHGLSVATVRLRCQRGAIPGAVKLGIRKWGIPKGNLAAGPGHEARGGDGELRRRERALRDIRAMALDVIERCDRELGE